VRSRVGCPHQILDRHKIPILSIEDGFSEHDHEGWRLLRQRLGERLFIIRDDLVTTNERTIEEAAGQGLINCARARRDSPIPAAGRPPAA